MVMVSLIAPQIGQATGAKKPPHIVFVMADDYGYSDVGYHGSEIKTSVLDEISANGVRLENYYVQPSCTPSRTQLLSGRYQIHTGLQHGIIWETQENALPTDSPTLADKLRESGYATHMVGKWHMGFYKTKYLPINRGFDTFYGFYGGSEYYFTHLKPLSRGLYLDLHDQDKPVYNETGHYSTHLFTEKAIQRIDSHDPSKPMFLYLSYQAVHEPMEVPGTYKKPYEHIEDKTRRIYAGMTAAMDEGIGNVTSALKDRGMWDDTVFVFSTDNGGAEHRGGNNYPLRGSKGSLWDGGMRGIGFVHAPNLETAGTVSKALIHITDWYPTFVGLAGGSLNGTLPLDGYDQWDTISKDVPSPRTEILHNIDPKTPLMGKLTHEGTFNHRVRAALRYGDWKLITGNPGSATWNHAPPFSRYYSTEKIPVWTNYKIQNLWLFNVKDDPREEFELSAQHPDIVKEMLGKLAAYNSTAVPVRYPPFPAPGSDPGKRDCILGPWVKEDETEVLPRYAPFTTNSFSRDVIQSFTIMTSCVVSILITK